MPFRSSDSGLRTWLTVRYPTATQNALAQVGYNGSCCGFGFESRRFSFGTIRNENQYLVVFRIANVGSAGTLRKAEKIF